jgi:cystathionine beta-lyase
LLEELIIDKAGLWLDGGAMFGAGGSGFQRLNIACPRRILEQAMTQLEKALKL